MTPASVQTLLDWCSTHGIRIDPRVALVQSDEGSISVVARAGIGSESTLVAIPKNAILSVRTCYVSEWFGDSYDLAHTSAFALATALCAEMQRGLLSPFFGYLQSLPTTCVDIAHLWERDSPEMQWLEGTPAQALIKRRDILPRARAYFREQVVPLLAQHEDLDEVEETDILHAYSLVSSRAFVVDAYHGMSMVPIADAFNHTNDFTIQMQTDYQVCASCGALFECEHDREDGDPVPDIIIAPEAVDLEDTCDMVTTEFIRAGDEVFNTYDAAGLSNTELLVRYGFILPGNGTGTACAMQYTVQELERLLETTSPSDRRVHLALRYVMEERKALEELEASLQSRDEV
ncbi:SET domain-containing protein [Exidia glandulosa HHB12029]|uniref:SET domain-containing protein n=1 Tax=Exidia glandulosa HHB12029 TaxID=1314781 RepID=A0A165M5K8_EXIGL|nr:SET domain-containing protein [Exidia glandulosa HHB12029]